MKIIVKKSILEACVKNLCKVINPKTSIPILGDILFDVNETLKTAKLTASDAEVTISSDVVLDECEGGGRFCINAQILAAMLSEVKDQPLVITATLESDMKFTMTYSDGSAFCPMLPADDYPMPTQHEYNENIEGLKGEWVRNALKRSLWATNNDDLRPVMNGVNFALVDGCLDIVATDGHVMMKSQKSIADKVATNRCGSFIMPKKVAKILSDIAEESDYVDIAWNDREAHIELFDYNIDFRLIEGKYPNYNSIIPQEYAHQVSCYRIPLLSAMKAVTPFAPDSSQLVTMTISSDNTLEVRGENFDFDAGAMKAIDVKGYYGEEISIGVKGSILIGILSKISTSEVLLKFNDPSRAIVIEPIDDDDKKKENDEHITGLFMPMLLSE